MDRIGKYYTLGEMTKTSTGLPNVPGPAEAAALGRLVALVLDPLRERLGRAVTVNSGYRNRAVNSKVGGSQTSQHIKGEAADIVVEGMLPSAVARAIVEAGLPFDQLIVEREDTKRLDVGWVHVSLTTSGRDRREMLQSPRAGVYLPWSP